MCIPSTTRCTSLSSLLFILIFIKSHILFLHILFVLHILLFCCFALFFILLHILLFISFFTYIYIYICSSVVLLLYNFVVLFFIFYYSLHCPLSGPDLTYISLLIIPCIIYHVTNKETLNLEPWYTWSLFEVIIYIICLYIWEAKSKLSHIVIYLFYLLIFCTSLFTILFIVYWLSILIIV